MSIKIKRWIFVLSGLLFVLLLAILSAPVSASAAQVTGAASNSCFTCHEDLYYLHDTGKYSCITEHKDRCVNCHAGDATTLKKDESHLGLITHPQKDDGARCQQCHTEDAQARLATFASLGGYKPVIEAVSYFPSSTTETEFPEISEPDPIVEKLPWLISAFVLFGFWLALVFLSPQKP